MAGQGHTAGIGLGLGNIFDNGAQEFLGARRFHVVAEPQAPMRRGYGMHAQAR